MSESCRVIEGEFTAKVISRGFEAVFSLPECRVALFDLDPPPHNVARRERLEHFYSIATVEDTRRALECLVAQEEVFPGTTFTEAAEIICRYSQGYDSRVVRQNPNGKSYAKSGSMGLRPEVPERNGTEGAPFRIIGRPGGRGAQMAAEHLCKGTSLLAPDDRCEIVENYRDVGDADLIALTDNRTRLDCVRAARSTPGPLLNSIHPGAVIDPSAKIYHNVIVKVGAVVGQRVVVADGAIIGEGAVVCHDSLLGECCHVMPGAVLCGAVQVGGLTDVGPGAVILGWQVLGSEVTVDAGVMVPFSVPNGKRVVRGAEGKAKIVGG